MPPPTITSFSPLVGKVGDTITITGTNFVPNLVMIIRNVQTDVLSDFGTINYIDSTSFTFRAPSQPANFFIKVVNVTNFEMSNWSETSFHNLSFSTTNSLITSSSGTFIANGVSNSIITILLKNDTGTILTNENILLRSNSITSIISGATNNGINGITFNVTNTKAESVIYTGYSGTSVILQTASVTFLPGPFDVGKSTVTSALTNVSTDTTTTLTVFVCDANSNGISGSSVTLIAINKSASSNITITAISSTTNTTGNAIFGISNTFAEQSTFQAAVNGTPITNTAAVTFLPGLFNAGTSTVTSALANVSTDSTTTLTVFVCDTNSNGIAGSSVTLSAINKSASSNITITPPLTTQSGPTGNATFTVSNTFAEQSTFQAAVNGTPITNTAAVTFLPGAVNAIKSTISQPTLTRVTADGNTQSTITVRLRDANNNLITTNIAVTLTSSSQTNVLNQTITSSQGIATFNVTNTVAESVNFTASISISGVQTTIGSVVTVNFIPGAFDVTRCSMTAFNSVTSVIADGANLLITVNLKDSTNNAINSETVILSSSSTHVTIQSASQISNTLGNATFTVKSTFAEPAVTFTSSVNGSTIKTLTITFIPGPISPTVSTFTSDISTVSTDAGTTVNLTVFLCDANRNAISGQSISINKTSPNISSISAVTTGANGIASFTITNTKAEQVTFTASALVNTVSTQLGQPVVVTFTPGIVSTLQSSFSTPTITTISTDNSTTILSFLVRDQNQNPIPNKTVILATNPANYSVVSSTPTDATGTATITIQNKVAETVTFNASSSGIPIGTQQLIFAPGQYSIITSNLIASLNAVSTDLDDGLVTITATIRDKNQNIIPSKAVTLSTTIASSVSVAVSTTQNTNTNGQITFNITNTKAETVTFIASANDGTQGVSMNQQATIAFLVGALSTTTSTISSATPASIVADGVVTSAITVMVKDKNQNRIPGLPIVLTPSAGARISAQTITSNQSIDIIFTLKSTVAESLTLTASSGQTQIGLPVNLTFVPGPFSPIASSITALLNQVTTDSNTTTTLNIIVCDFFKNTINGSTVTISASSTNPVISLASQITSADGKASFTVYNNKAESVIFIGLVQPQGSQTNTAITNTSTITFFPGNPLPSNCLISITKGSDPFTVNGRNVPINVTLRDMHANNIIGLATSLKGTKTDNSISTTFRCSPSISDSNGIVALQVNNSAEEQVTCVPTFNFSLAWTSPNVSLNFKIGPRITGVAPNCGRPGKNITLYGQNFLADTIVKINEKAATKFKLLSKSKMICTIPANIKGRYPIVVTNPNDTSFTSSLFNSY